LFQSTLHVGKAQSPQSKTSAERSSQSPVIFETKEASEFYEFMLKNQ